MMSQIFFWEVVNLLPRMVCSNKTKTLQIKESEHIARNKWGKTHLRTCHGSRVSGFSLVEE